MQEIRVRPAPLRELMRKAAHEIERERVRRGLSYRALCRAVGWESRGRAQSLSFFCAGDLSALGPEAVCRVLEYLRIPVTIDIGRPQLAAPCMVPALSDLSQVAA